MTRLFTYLFILLLLLTVAEVHAQIRGLPRNLPGTTSGRGGTSDTLRRRDSNEDSLTIKYRLLDSAQWKRIDSSINDFTVRFPIPATHVYLGNTGSATRSILFSPTLKAGWDHGHHVFDVYKFRINEIPFYNTTRPYSELGYLLGTRTEQIIDVLHTQNLKANWNAAFRYRLINSPGIFKNQKTNHNNYLFSSWYQSINQRYNNFFVLLANHFQAAENGGIRDDKDYLKDPIFEDRFNIPTRIGGDPPFGRDFFSSKIATGNKHREFTLLLRQQYDFGRKDSIVTDSTVIPLFFPRLRFEHTFRFNTYKFNFFDFLESGNRPDSAFYKDFYNISIVNDTIHFREKWKEFRNDFSIYQFPDAKNLQQFIRAGVSLQLLNAEFTNINKSYFNFSINAEYRNRTRNQKWEMLASGQLFVNGLNAGDYEAYVSLQRYVGKNIGYLRVGFENVNRNPSFNFDALSSFYLDVPKDFKNENTSHIFAQIINPALRLKLSGDYFLISNYTYFKDYFEAQQASALFNFLRVSAEKTFRLSRRFNLYSEIYIQQKAGTVELNVPLIYTRNRFAFEGIFYKNLNISTGLEIRYHTPYKADDYSPVIQQFFFQDSIRINNRPDIHAFVHFRIKSFKAYFRVENLNSMDNQNGFGFTANNLAARRYPYPGMVMRLGIYWNFVN